MIDLVSRIILLHGIRKWFASMNWFVMHRNPMKKKSFELTKVLLSARQRMLLFMISCSSFLKMVESMPCLSKYETSILSIRITSSFQKGTSRQSLTFAQNEGEVNTMSSNGQFLVIGSTKAYVKVFDVSRRSVSMSDVRSISLFVS